MTLGAPGSIVAYLTGAVLIIYIAGTPGDFSYGSALYNPILFAWTAAFFSNTNAQLSVFWAVLIAVYYAVHMDDGLALGSLALITMAMAINLARKFFQHQDVVTRIGLISLIYFGLMFMRNAVMMLFFMPRSTLTELIWQSIVFMLVFGTITWAIVSMNKAGLSVSRRGKNG